MAHTSWNDHRTAGLPPPGSAGSAANGGLGLHPSPSAPTSALVDLGHLWQLLRQRWLWVAGVTVLVFGGAMAVTMTAPMEFVSTGRLYLGDLEQSAGEGGQDGLHLSAGLHGDVASEIEILKSQSLVRKAVLASGLNVSLLPSGEKPTRYWEWRLSDRDPELVDIALRHVRAVAASFDEPRREGERYEVRFTDDRRFEIASESGASARGRLDEPVRIGDLQVILLEGTEGAPLPGSAYDMTVRPVEAVTSHAAATLEVLSVKGSGALEPAKVLTLGFRADSPFLAAEFLDQLMRSYLGQRQRWKSEQATAAEAFVSEQLAGLRASLDGAESDLAEYRRDNPVVVLDSEAEAMIQQIAKYEEQRVAARLEVAALSDVKRALRDPDVPVEAYMLGEANDTVLAGLATALAEARRQLTELETKFKAPVPEVREQRAQVQAQLESIKSYVTNRLQRAQDNLSTLNRVIGQFEAKLKSVPGAELQLTQLARESEVYSTLYSYLLERQQQAAIVKASTVSKHRVLDEPQVPFREDSPKLVIGLAFGPLGLLLGSALVIATSIFGTTLQTVDDVRRTIGGIPIFARIPGQAFRRRHAYPRVIGPGSVSSLSFEFVEAFRALRTRLYHAYQGAQGKVVLVTSPEPGDGKTTCAFALASMLAADGKSVLLVDADLRTPSHRSLLEAGSRRDLRDLLRGDCDWIDVAKPVEGAAGRLYSIAPAGAGSSELLSSPTMHRFLKDARRDWDAIIVDASAFPLTSDALTLSNDADCILSVVRLMKTSRSLLAEHVLGLATPRPCLHAVVVNDPSSKGMYRVRFTPVELESHAPPYTEPSPAPAYLPVESVRPLRRDPSDAAVAAERA